MARYADPPMWTYETRDTAAETRTEALRLAIDTTGPGASSKAVIETAEVYYNFLIGKSFCNTCKRAAAPVVM